MKRVGMNKIIFLHIGIWKTGTTTIQKTLYQNREILLEKGVCYPDLSYNHTFLASTFHDSPNDFVVAKSHRLSGDALDQWHRDSLKKFEKANVGQFLGWIEAAEGNITIATKHEALYCYNLCGVRFCVCSV